MTQKFANNARSRLVGALSNSATSFTIEASTADLFPIANTVDWLVPNAWFKATIENSLGQVEIVKVGVRALGSAIISNVQRGQDGTAAIAFDAGAVVGLRITHKDIEDALAGNLDQLAVSGPSVHNGPTTLNGRITHNGVESRTVPVGGIIMYDGLVADIPPGWQLCDGSNGTPDLSDKFVIGARQDDAGTTKTNVTGALTKSGGSKDAVVVAHAHGASSGNQSASHTHSGTTSTGGGHQHAFSNGAYTQGGLGYNTGAGAAQVTSASTAFAGDHNHTITTGAQSADHNHAITVNSSGESGTNKNLPPYYALAFIKCMAYAP